MANLDVMKEVRIAIPEIRHIENQSVVFIGFVAIDPQQFGILQLCSIANRKSGLRP